LPHNIIRHDDSFLEPSLKSTAENYRYRPESLAGHHVDRFRQVTIVIYQSSWK